MRYVRMLLVALLAIILVGVALANRQLVTVSLFPGRLDRYMGGDWQVQMPLFLVIILALSFLNSVWPAMTLFATITMYVYILAVLFDGFLMWRGFKALLAARMPGTSPRGLLMYGITRGTQLRRFRMPAPRIKRGDKF